MPGGHPKKKSKNISGLCNQQKPMPSITESVAADSSVKNSAQGHNIQESDQDESDVENLTIALDGLKINFEVEYEAEMTEDSEVDEEIELEMLNNVEFGQKLAQMVEHEAEKDLDWVPRVLQLADHKFLSDPSSVDDSEGLGVVTEADSDSSHGTGEGLDLEDWEDELHESISTTTMIHDWGTLRTQIQLDLKKKHKELSLAKVNQLMILSNFATLRLKGATQTKASLEIAQQWHIGSGNGSWFAQRVCALARHYQVFEQLPVEKHGGHRLGHSLLHDESVQNHTRRWLSNLKTGEVTPHMLQHALTSTIFPELGINPRQPISEHTARQWLIKLGWRKTVIRKGVYMDGHECADVVEYRQGVFLPVMKEYERRMVHFDGPDLVHVEPDLFPGEKPIKAYFHDECSFHANDNVSHAWLRPGEQPLRKKGRGRLIHVSDFINSESGCLVAGADDGKITWDARKIIYPGANGDPWWTHENLLHQMKEAIEIHNETSPEYQALFIFDNSSAHASLPPDALKAFEMNKTDGHTQKMTTATGEPKGLKSVLEEWGFSVTGLKTKCSPYWGWCKYTSVLYHYREALKPSFASAKQAAHEILDSCPVEVLCRFINRSFRFMSAYRLGLTGKAAEWAVRKQKQHRSVSQQAMMMIEAMLA
ncbi:hypothetical protein PISMIDRAFT_29102 [Pisolithus microcarpus 441]|uniref:DDE-1 domain-containing protein n=1 Tax=Pisolithus microcarpus 441 TaxID=765257 RepID=A0A0C9ZFD5_9AGAM|nr:hypothetical protein PISMIDRAFT_29102 [Pisolithus microcarpus 441]